MNEMKELREKYYKISVNKKDSAWKVNNYEQAVKIRKEQKESYEKWKLIKGIIKVNEKKGDK